VQQRVPVDQALAAVDEALLPQAHEGLDDGVVANVVHREALARPVGGGAHGLQLLDDAAAVLVLPGPDLFEERLAAEVVTRLVLVTLQLALDDGLGGNAGVVDSGQPQRRLTAHAVGARQQVLERDEQRVAHVQRARDVGRRHHDHIGLLVAGARGVHVGGEDAGVVPARVPVRLDGGGVVGGGEVGGGASSGGGGGLRRRHACALAGWRQRPKYLDGGRQQAAVSGARVDRTHA